MDIFSYLVTEEQSSFLIFEGGASIVIFLEKQLLTIAEIEGFGKS